MLLGSILRRPGRSFMTVIAIMISTSLLISMLSITEGLRNRNRAYLETGNQDIFITAPGIRGGIHRGREIVNTMEDDSNNISAASPILITSIRLQFLGDIYTVIAIGVIPEKIEKFLTKDGSIELYMMVLRFNEWFKTPGDPHFNNSYTSPYTGEILVNSKFIEKIGFGYLFSLPVEYANYLTNGSISGKLKNAFKDNGIELSSAAERILQIYDNVWQIMDGNEEYRIEVSEREIYIYGRGKGDHLGMRFQSSSVENFTVTGSFESPLTGGGLFGMIFQGIVLMHLSELQSLVGSDIIPDTGEVQDKVSSIVLSVQGDKKKASSVKRIALDIQEEYPLFAVLTKSDRLALIEERSEIGDIFYTAVGTVTLVIGLLFVACIMVISVYERQGEIGVLRAIGISKRTIFKQIFLESLVLIIIGAGIGIVPGYFGSQYVSDFMAGKYGLDMELTSFSQGLVLRCMLYVIAIGCLFSLYPALKASKLEIIDAMRKQ